jgi:hypothetical protein
LWILSFGDAARLLKPETPANEVSETIGNMRNQYKHSSLIFQIKEIKHDELQTEVLG